MEKKSNFKKTAITMTIVVVMILAIIGIYMKNGLEAPVIIDNACCDRICAGIGFGVECLSIFNNEVKCKMNMGRYAKPELAEVFTFNVLDVDKACKVDKVDNVAPVDKVEKVDNVEPAEEEIELNQTEV